MGTLWYNLATKRCQKYLKHCPQYCPHSCFKLIQLSKSNIMVNIKIHIWSPKIKSFPRLFQSIMGFRGFQISLIIFLLDQNLYIIILLVWCYIIFQRYMALTEPFFMVKYEFLIITKIENPYDGSLSGVTINWCRIIFLPAHDFFIELFFFFERKKKLSSILNATAAVIYLT